MGPGRYCVPLDAYQSTMLHRFEQESECEPWFRSKTYKFVAAVIRSQVPCWRAKSVKPTPWLALCCRVICNRCVSDLASKVCNRSHLDQNQLECLANNPIGVCLFIDRLSCRGLVNNIGPSSTHSSIPELIEYIKGIELRTLPVNLQVHGIVHNYDRTQNL